ncbi:MAG: hypothetical protein KF883_01980 [Thermomicrobiales bacterium]|nr:hypothetical protein [Thermomicrobiales bacterium]
MTQQSTSAPSSIRLANQFWDVEIGVGADPGPHRIVDLTNNLVVADERYCYDITVRTNGVTHVALGIDDVIARESQDEHGQTVTIEARFIFGRRGPTDIGFRHRITLPESGGFLEEQITLLHIYGTDAHELTDLRFGFRKVLFDRAAFEWRDRSDAFRLVPVPHRRRFGISLDRRKEDYTAADLFRKAWEPHTSLPDFGSEAWAWTNGEHGVLIAKYNQEAIEFSLFEGEYLVPEAHKSHPTNPVASHVPVPVNHCARFGGIGLYRGDPECGQRLQGCVEVPFGITRIFAFAGGWEQGYDTYRAHLRALGHSTPSGFDPPLHWNELYNIGWRLGDNSPLQTLPALEREASFAAEIGAEALYLDPTWDTSEGTTIWDSNRLGPQADFVQMLADRFGLKLSLHLMMHTTDLEEDPAFYHRDADGNTIEFMGHRDVIYPNACVCCGSDVWKQTKIDRLRALADAGATFMMFDFLQYGLFERDDDERALCHDPSHGHPVPLTRQRHAEGILEVIQAVKETHPQVLIEAHDRINGGLQDYHPLYFQHGLPNSFDSNWGFEYMWDPYYDLLSGKALSLYEYNLAYDIPLYLHIHEGRDSPTMLAFWWYASTCRHLGIGGVSDPQNPVYQALKQAVATYLRLKPFFTQGEFIGIDLYAHLHVIQAEQAAVAVLFNMTSEPMVREVRVPASQLGVRAPIMARDGATLTTGDGIATLTVEIPPLSPRVVELAWAGE